jgi:hypothetical protein
MTQAIKRLVTHSHPSCVPRHNLLCLQASRK